MNQVSMKVGSYEYLVCNSRASDTVKIIFQQLYSGERYTCTLRRVEFAIFVKWLSALNDYVVKQDQ